jgi:hypothetical protein
MGEQERDTETAEHESGEPLPPPISIPEENLKKSKRRTGKAEQAE